MQVVAGVVTEIKAALNVTIGQISALKAVSLEKVLCNTVGGVLGAADIAALLVTLLTVSAFNPLP